MPYRFELTRATKCLAKTQSTFGTAAYGTGGIDDVTLLAPTIVQPRPELVDVSFFTGSLTQRPSVLGAQLCDVTIEGPLYGSGTAGSIAANGARAIDALLQAAGLSRTSSASEVRYDVATATELVDGSASCMPATVGTEHGGARIYVRDVVGAMTVTAEVNRLLRYRFQGQGIFDLADMTAITGYTGGVASVIPVRGITTRFVRWTQTLNLVSATAGATTVFTCDQSVTLAVGDWVGITGLTGNWRPANGLWQVTAVTGSTFTIGLNSTGFGSLTGTGQAGGSAQQVYAGLSFELDTGGRPSRVQDYHTATGLRRMMITERQPRATITWVADRETSGLGSFTTSQLINHVMQGGYFALRVQVGSATGNTWIFDIPQGQAAGELTFDQQDNVRSIRLPLNAVSSGIDSELVIKVV